MVKLIWVKPGSDDGRVALFEQHRDHPGGEAFVAGPPVQVAVTPLVERKLASGELAKVDAPLPGQATESPVRKTKAEIEDELRAAGNSFAALEDRPGVAIKAQAPAVVAQVPATKPTAKK